MEGDNPARSFLTPGGPPGSEVPLSGPRFRIGLAAVVLLVLLRISIGWHFLYQGLWKLNRPDFSSEGFLSQAKGPLAPYFQKLLPDFFGAERLGADGREKSVAALDEYLESFRKTYSLSAEQDAKAAGWVKVHKSALTTFFKENEEEFDKYLRDVERFDTAKDDPTHVRGNKYLADRQAELRATSAPWLNQIAGIGDKCRSDLELLLTAEQKQTPPPAVPGASAPAWQDMVVTYSNIAIGVCLIAGLLTRSSAFFGGLFLALIVAAQPDWPGLYPTPHPSAGRSLLVNKEFVEMMALFVLASLPVGRWGGLDFCIHRFVSRRQASGKEHA